LTTVKQSQLQTPNSETCSNQTSLLWGNALRVLLDRYWNFTSNGTISKLHSAAIRENYMHRGGQREADDHGKNDESSDDQPYEGDDDGLGELSADHSEDLESTRPDIVEKVFRTLSADAQRGDNELQRSDVNRTYLRKHLSVAECMAVEERIVAAGYRVIDEDEDEKNGEGTNGSRSAYRYLTEAEEKDFGRRIQLALHLPEDTSNLEQTYVGRVLKDAERAKAAFVISNIRFVEQLARRMGEHRHLSLEDVIQEV
jgi:RNA polymerase primary sigma factor